MTRTDLISAILATCLFAGSLLAQEPVKPDSITTARVELDARWSDGRRNAGRSTPRDGGAPRPFREDARRASLVGLVRALSERA